LQLDYEAQVTDMAWRPNGTHIAATGHGTVNIWNIPSGELIATFQKIDTRENVEEVAWSPSSNYIASTDVMTIEVWDVITGQLALSSDTQVGIEGLVWQSEQTILYGGNPSAAIHTLNLPLTLSSTFSPSPTPDS
jgi:WD40 repeat protein